MQLMLEHLLTRHRRRPPRSSTGRLDRRAGAPARREPEPMPRMRWY
jgi:hypothetical protein